mmetsp:Transcript_38844/g.39234  ORF Transcript_38844/g.39234 Transcript_38844/m.39234 type:complete len:93 (-) Transcript_38844:370-648(-)
MGVHGVSCYPGRRIRNQPSSAALSETARDWSEKEVELPTGHVRGIHRGAENSTTGGHNGAAKASGREGEGIEPRRTSGRRVLYRVIVRATRE